MQVIATAGHVDHGKSTLLRALTGMEPDRWAEERRRGMTIDLGFVWTELPGSHTVAFVDVPGHERFVNTMLAGIGPVPAVLFVVAADEGWMPQSTEHLDALAALGTTDGLLVITRSDLMEPELALEEAREHLESTPLSAMASVCVSGATGAGLDELARALAEMVDRLPTPDPDDDVRLWVDRAFTIRGTGTVVTGTLPRGRIRVGDELLLEPGGRRVTVRGLQELSRSTEEVTGVARVAVSLRGLPRAAVRRGDVLTSPGRWLTSTAVDVRLHRVAAGELPVQLQLHIGAASVPVRVRPLGPVDPVTEHDSDAAHDASPSQNGTACAENAAAVTARLTLRTPLPLRIGDRAILRDPGSHRIVAGLSVLDVRPPPLHRRGAAARRAAQLISFTSVPDAGAELARRGLARRDELAAMGADPNQLGEDQALRAGDWLISRWKADELAELLVTSVTQRDADDPLDSGLPLGAARHALGAPDARVVDAVLNWPPAKDALVQRNGRVRRRESRDDSLTPGLRAARDAVREELAHNPFAAPDANRLAELGLGAKELAALVRASELVRVAEGIYLLPGAEETAVRLLSELDQEEFTLSAARQALRTSRRVAVPLLERLAKLGHTVRTPDGLHRIASRSRGPSS